MTDIKLMIQHFPDGSVSLKSSSNSERIEVYVHDWLFHWAELTPNNNFLSERINGVQKWAGISYKQASESVTSLAKAFSGMGLGNDRPIVILSGNTILHQIVSLSAMKAGVPFAPISPAYSTVEGAAAKLRHILNVLNPGLVYAEDGKEFSRALSIHEMAGRKIVVGKNADSVAGAVTLKSLETFGSSAQGLNDREPVITQDTIVKFIFTSGTTGSPKGVITTHRMIREDVESVGSILAMSTNRPWVAVDWLPWSHVYGGSFGVGAVLCNGGNLFIDDGRPVGAEYARTIENLTGISPTFFWNVPKAYELLVNELKANETLCKTFFARLEVMIYGAASLPEKVMETMYELVNKYAGRDIPMIPAWGMTETTTIATLSPTRPVVSNAIGVPLPGVEIKLVPNGDKFEARLRGPIVTPGYWRMLDFTLSAFDEEGYFRTGDAMRLFDDTRPELGLVFEGRIAEDFKLLSGTWVNVTEVRARCLAVLGDLASDIVIVGPDRDDLILLIFAYSNINKTDNYKIKVQETLSRINEGVSGGSRIISRVAILQENPIAALGEITDKGSLNAKIILQRRADFIDGLYSGEIPSLIVPKKMGEKFQ